MFDTMQQTFYDVEHEGDAEKIYQKLKSYGAKNITYTLSDDDESADFSWEYQLTDRDKIAQIVWP